MTSVPRVWWRRPRVGATLALVVAVGIGTLVVWPAAPPVSAPAKAAGAALLPEPVEPAFRPSEPRRARRSEANLSRWAPVVRGVDARKAPGSSRIVGHLDELTPEGTTNIAVVTDSTEDAGGRLWVRVRLAALPNNLTGWVPRASLGGYGIVRTHLVVDRESLTATLYRGRHAIFRAEVGVGQDAYPTPSGRFYVRNKLTRFANPAYGPLAFGTSARSDVLTDWPAGGFVGIHGTDEPELLPGRVSHGCIRMRNEDILRLARLMPVGTPLTIT